MQILIFTLRLGERWEWETSVIAIRNSNFRRGSSQIKIDTSFAFPGGLGTLDEVEIFEGDHFVLRMTQTYAHRFQCDFDLALYPFDTQVIYCVVLLMHIFSCKLLTHLCIA